MIGGHAQQSVSFADLPSPGRPLAGGTFICRYEVAGTPFALVLLPGQIESFWGQTRQDLDGARCILDGLSNTLAMADAGSELALSALHLGAYIPSCIEGMLLLGARASGVPLDLQIDRWHWLSTQMNADSAFSQSYGFGWQQHFEKDEVRVARLVRRLRVA